MRISILTSAMLLAFVVWGGASTSQNLKFVDRPSPDPAPGPASAMGDPMRGEEIDQGLCVRCASIEARRIGPAYRARAERLAEPAPDDSYSPGL